MLDQHVARPAAVAVPRAGTRAWIGLAVLALPTLLVSIDVSLMLLALPRIGADLGASSAQQLWIMDIYGFMLAGFMITMGTLGDRIGRRNCSCAARLPSGAPRRSPRFPPALRC